MSGNGPSYFWTSGVSLSDLYGAVTIVPIDPTRINDPTVIIKGTGVLGGGQVKDFEIVSGGVQRGVLIDAFIQTCGRVFQTDVAHVLQSKAMFDDVARIAAEPFSDQGVTPANVIDAISINGWHEPSS